MGFEVETKCLPSNIDIETQTKLNESSGHWGLLMQPKNMALGCIKQQLSLNQHE